MYLQRTLRDFVLKSSGQLPVLLVTGARQVGKTTFLQHISEHERAYVTLDDPIIMSLAREDPGLFMQRYPPPVLIDEIQYAPELLPYIKMAVDREHKPGMYWLTGLQHFQMMKEISESLAGRVGIINLFGFSRREALGQSDKSRPFLPLPEEIRNRIDQTDAISLKELFKIIWRGSFPAIVVSKELDRDLFYSSYVGTYLQRDVRDLTHVGDETAFLRFLRASAARTAQLLNLSELARDADVTPSTARTWLSILQASGLVYLLEPYHANITKRLVKTPKLYFLDTGLCAYLTEWSSPETLEAGAMSGAALETWVIAEIIKSYRHNGRNAPFYFYRDKDKKEIDLLIVQDGTVYSVEIKKTASPKRDHVRHFSTLEKLNLPIGPGGVICLYEQFIPLTESAYSIPVSAL